MPKLNTMYDVFESPEWYPIRINWLRRTLEFVRMSPDSYKESVFLDSRTRHLGKGIFDIRLDDLLLAALTSPPQAKIVHYILHTTFCCSTLLARYFELVPSCFVLKEPAVLTQLALSPDPQSSPLWQEVFDLCLRLLTTRTYGSEEFVIIKPHEPVNSIVTTLLERNARASATFISTDLRFFLLSVLKSQERRDWVRRRVASMEVPEVLCPDLANINRNGLADAEAAAFLWSVNRALCWQLASIVDGARLFVLDAEKLLTSPAAVLRAVAAIARVPIDGQALEQLISHPSMRKYSKDPARPYDASARRVELTDMEGRYGSEASRGLEWAASHGVRLEKQALRNVFETELAQES